MTTGETSPAPAGWHPDPWKQAELRWFDGAQWTGHVHPAPANVAAPSVAASTPDPRDVLADDSAWSLYPDAQGGVAPVIDRDAHAANRSNQNRYALIAFVVLVVGSVFAGVLLPVLVIGVPVAMIVFRKRVGALWRHFAGWRAHSAELISAMLESRGMAVPGIGVGGFRRLKPASNEQWPAAYAHSSMGVLWTIDGRPWGAAEGARITVFSSGPRMLKNESEMSHLVISIPLPAAVSARFPGLVVLPTLESRQAAAPAVVRAIGSSRKSVEFGGNISRLRKLITIDFGATDAGRRWTLHRVPEQDEVALFELFSTTFLEQLGQSLDESGVSTDLSFMVTDGRLLVWDQQDPLIGMVQPWGDPTVAVASLDVFLEFAMRVHRRMIEEWR
jgi:hypothetical protein